MRLSVSGRARGSLLALSLVALTACSTGTPQHIVIPDTPSPVVAPAADASNVEPVSIDIPRLNAHSTLPKLGLNKDGSAAVPDVHHPQQAGYYAASSPKPGQPGPPLVVIAHVDGDGQEGLFFHLSEMRPGDIASVKLTDGRTLNFRVVSEESDSKTAFPASKVFAPQNHATLRLITCGGAFDKAHRNYLSNIIVLADLV